jgi:membrane protein DedA with SNARE-associated domain
MPHKIICTLAFLFAYHLGFSQSVLEETFFRSGKINVVVAVILVILVGLFVYLFRLNKKIDQLKK